MIDLKNWWKTLNLRLQQERRKEETYEINKHIDNHCEAIQGELKPILNSLLERSSKKIKVDRIMKVSGDEKILLTEEKEVLSEVRSHFMKQFRKRNIDKNGLSARWAKAYSPIKKIDNKIYKDLLSKVTEED